MSRSKVAWYGMVLLVLLLSASAFCQETGDAYFNLVKESGTSEALKSTKSISTRAGSPYIINNFITNDNTNFTVQRVSLASSTVYYVARYLATNTGNGTIIYIITDAMGVTYYLKSFSTNDTANAIYRGSISISLSAGDYKFQTLYLDVSGNMAASEPFTFNLQ
ncbi:MAG: hypothetical protein HQK89_07855 [Nitrospirae bacterium]|nr:hypothetical protein [Nitrospirota bacterium]